MRTRKEFDFGRGSEDRKGERWKECEWEKNKGGIMLLPVCGQYCIGL